MSPISFASWLFEFVFYGVDAFSELLENKSAVLQKYSSKDRKKERKKQKNKRTRK